MFLVSSGEIEISLNSHLRSKIPFIPVITSSPEIYLIVLSSEIFVQMSSANSEENQKRCSFHGW